MNNGKRKILALIIAIAVVGYWFGGDELLNIKVANAHADMKIQTTDTNCDDGAQDCSQEHSEDCGSCVTYHNTCHSDYLLPPLYKFDLLKSQVLPNLLDVSNYSSLNYPPDVPPC